jgi:choline dehydrogenase-like flavoprotein
VRVRGLTVLRWRRPLRERVGVTNTADPDATLFEELAPGGLSNHWSCAVPRFAPEDFADAERAGEAYRWPIGYDDLAPWYERVEPLLHVAGAAHGTEQLPGGKVLHTRELQDDWSPMVEGAREAGRTIAPMPYAYGADTTLTFSGTVFNSFVRLIQPELRSGRITTRFGARVLRLEWSKATRRVEAVVFRDNRSGGENRVPCRAVVLAAGAICTPEILLASACADFPAGLGNSTGLLGRYLHDHPVAKLVVDLDRPVSVFPPSYLTRPTLERSPPLYAAACMQWSGSELLARSILHGKLGRLPWIGFSVFGTMAPSKDDWVAIDGAGRGTQGRSGLNLHINHPPEAKAALEQARDDMVSVLSRAGLGARVRFWHVEPPCRSAHYGGTCRMHASPRFGVVDSWNRVHDAPNVVVADSAAFTTGPEKNPVLTSMALAARAGQHLAEELKTGDL